MSREALEAAKFAKELAKLGLTPNDNDPLSDFFVGTSSRETFNGGNGADTVSYKDSTGAVRINLADTFAEGGGFANGDTLISIENIIGSAQGDNILGSTGANVIHAFDGDDVVDGNGGSDRIHGGGGNDTLQVSTRPGEFAVLSGGSGSDILIFNSQGGRAEITTGTDLDLVNIKVRTADEFHAVITDFQPFLNHNGATPTVAQAALGDRIQFSFNNDLLSPRSVFPAFEGERVGDDFVMTFTDGHIHGDVVFVGLSAFAGNDPFSFRIDVDFLARPPAPV